MVRTLANHFAFPVFLAPPEMPSPRPSSPARSPDALAARVRPRGRRIGWGVGLALLLLAVGAGWWRTRLPLLPIPAPANLAQLDPQVRDHLVRTAQRAAETPRLPAPRAELGLAFAANGLWKEARQCFLDAVRLGSREPWPRLYAAVAREEAGDPDGARAELTDLTRDYPDCAPGWQRLGVRALAEGDLPSASRAFQRVTELVPSEWRGWAGLGEARWRAGQASAAQTCLEKSLELDPFARPARYVLAQVYRALNQSAEADLESAAGQSAAVGPMADPWSEAALRHMKGLPDQFEHADALLARGEGQAAVALLREAYRYHPTQLGVVSRFAQTLASAGQATEAWALLQPHLQQNSNDVRLLITGSAIAAEMAQPQVALPLAQRARTLAPQQAEGLVAEANARLAAHEDSAAADLLRQATVLAPRDVGLWIQLGDVLQSNLRQTDAARQALERAVSLDPIHPVALQRLIELHLAQSNATPAQARLAQWRRLAPDPAAVRDVEDRLRQIGTPP